MIKELISSASLDHIHHHSLFFQLEKHAQDIYNKYLSPKAASPVNLDGACRELVEEAIKNPTPEMFRTQQQQVGIHNWK